MIPLFSMCPLAGMISHPHPHHSFNWFQMKDHTAFNSFRLYLVNGHFENWLEKYIDRNLVRELEDPELWGCSNRPFSLQMCKKMPPQQDQLCIKAAAVMQGKGLKQQQQQKNTLWDSRRIPPACIMKLDKKKDCVRPSESILFYRIAPQTWWGPIVI